MTVLLRALTLTPAAALVLAGPAFAHGGHADHGGFADGFLHPLTGFDHAIVMVAVGMLAVRRGGAALLGLPAVFLLMMAAGAALALAGLAAPFVEAVAVLSVIVAVAAVLAPRAAIGWLEAMVCGAFAIAHGWLHGAEAPVGGDVGAWMAGVFLGTFVLHAAGAALMASVIAARSGLAHARRG